MASRYDRMMQKIEDHPAHVNRIAIVSLIWATYSFRPLQFNELRAGLETEFPDLTSLGDAMRRGCGDFLRLPAESLSLVHQTARHYLIRCHSEAHHPLHLQEANKYISATCLRYLSSSRHRPWRQILNMAEAQRSPSSLSTSSVPDLGQAWPF